MLFGVSIMLTGVNVPRSKGRNTIPLRAGPHFPSPYQFIIHLITLYSTLCFVSSFVCDINGHVDCESSSNNLLHNDSELCWRVSDCATFWTCFIYVHLSHNFCVFLYGIFTSPTKITSTNKYPILIIHFQAFLFRLGLPDCIRLRCCTIKNK